MRDNTRIAESLRSLGTEQIAVAELEAYGLPLRIINLLEDNLGVIWLDDLLKFTPQQLKERVRNLGDRSVEVILDSLDRFTKRRPPANQRRAPATGPLLDLSLPLSWNSHTSL